MSVFDGLSRPMRAAGLGLLAVAVVAAVVGGITLVTGNGDDGNGTAAPTTSEPASSPTEGPGGTSRQPTTQTSPPTSESPTGSATTTPRPGTPTRGPAAGNGENGDAGDGNGDGADGQDQQASAKWVGVRVYNNSTIKGLAHEAADDFRAQGWNVIQVGNYSSGIIPTTTAYFRPGTDEETAAKALAAEFGIRAEPRFEGIEDSSPGVIVIVTKEYGGTEQGK